MRYPDDARARAVLEEYLRSFDGDVMPWVFEAQDLDFRGAVLDGLNLQGAALHGARLDGVSLRGTDIAGARLWGASLRGADFTGAEIVKAELYGADATDATFDDLVYAARADFDEASLRRATFRRSRISSVSFLEADLRDTDFAGSTLYRVSFRDAKLHGASFDAASGSITARGAYVDEEASELLDPEELANWIMARGATDVTVYYSPLVTG